MIGELTIANRVFNKTLGRVELNAEIRRMITTSCQRNSRRTAASTLENCAFSSATGMVIMYGPCEQSDTLSRAT